MVSFFVLVVSENLESESQEKFKGKKAFNLTMKHYIIIKLTDIFDFVFRFDPRTNTFLQLVPMIHERGDFYACHINGFIYVFGGKNHNGPIRACEK